MNRNRILTLSILLLLVFANPAQSAIEVEWGVEVGSVATYWLDEITFSGSENTNWADLLLDPANRTQVLAVTNMGDNYINYTLGFMNGSVTSPVYVQMEEFPSPFGSSFLFPSTGVSFILPITTIIDGVEQNYLSSIASNIDVLEFLVDEIDFASMNITEPEVEFDGSVGTYMNLTGLLTFQGLNTSVGEFISLLGNFSDFGFTSFNFEELDLDNSTVITDLTINANLSYNRTDGTLQEVVIGAETTSVVETELGNETIIQQFNSKLTRLSIYTPQELLDQLSKKEKSPLLIVALVPIILLLAIIRKKLLIELRGRN